ncbi:MAG: transcriptional regulator [Acidobacteria bacterium]|nr:transcriptional regulator [Acidobacteriota bacterium]
MILAVVKRVDEADFLFLMDQTELPKGNLSSHLAKLESAGYVDVEKTFVDKIP